MTKEEIEILDRGHYPLAVLHSIGKDGIARGIGLAKRLNPDLSQPEVVFYVKTLQKYGKELF